MDDFGYIGVDPGVSGGASILDYHGSIIDVVAFKKMTDRDIADWFQEWGSHGSVAVIEKVHSMPRQGVASTFKFGRSFGFLEACLVCCHIPYTLVTPQKWQGYLDCKTGGDKNVTKKAAQMRWPGQKFTHAIADAVLIAEYGRLTKG